MGDAQVGPLQNRQSLGVGGHDPVLDPVVDHLDKVPRAGRTAMEVAHLPRPRFPLLAGSSRSSVYPGGEGIPEGLETSKRLAIATDHQTETAFETVHPPARSNVEIGDFEIA